MRARCVARLRRGLCAAQPQRGAAELGPLALRQSSPFFPSRLALLDDAKGQMKTTPISTAVGIDSVRCAFPPPSCSAEQRSGAGGSRRGLSEGQSPEFRSRPAARVAQGSRRSRPRNAGVAFFLVTFSWRRKKKLHAVRAENSVTAAPSPVARARSKQKLGHIHKILRHSSQWLRPLHRQLAQRLVRRILVHAARLHQHTFGLLDDLAL